MENIGVRGTPLSLSQSYLFNRTQRVTINKVISIDASISFGVPQGSILGPSIFLINELCMYKPPHRKIYTFADDTALVFEGDSWDQVRQCAEEGLSNVIIWLVNYLLTINLTKTKYIAFNRLKTKSSFLNYRHTHANPAEKRTSAVAYI